jgi:hypothetical protein
MSLTVQELLDREMIRDTLSDYSVTKDLGLSLQPSVDAFHPDGSLQTTNGRIRRGRKEIESFFRDLADRRRGGEEVFARHWLYPCQFKFLSPDTAETVTYMIALTERGLDQVVTYRDQLVKEHDRWYIMFRRISIEYQIAHSRLDLPDMVVRTRQSPPPDA